MTEKKTIREIAISHQRQMSSVHPHAIIATIEDAIEEFAAQQSKMPDCISIEEYDHALNHIGELQKEIKQLKEELSGREFNDKYRW